MKYLFKLKYLSIIGIIGFIINNNFLKLFVLFILLFFLEWYFKYKEKKQEIPYYNQYLSQIIGKKYLNWRYKKNYPTPDNFEYKNEYILPFEGEWYVEFGGNTPKTSHSWDLISQRYAYDFEIRDEDNKIYNGNLLNLESHYCYRKNVLAPLDGVVIEIRDEYEDTPMRYDRIGQCACEDIRGNHIVIKHKNNEYSLIAHLLKDSILVNLGDQVKQGDIIGKCGNSGNTNAPHIHFQVSNGKSFTRSVSLPIYFKNIGKLESGIKIKNI